MNRRIVTWVATGAVVLGIGAAGVGAVVANSNASAKNSAPVDRRDDDTEHVHHDLHARDVFGAGRRDAGRRWASRTRDRHSRWVRLERLSQARRRAAATPWKPALQQARRKEDDGSTKRTMT